MIIYIACWILLGIIGTGWSLYSALKIHPYGNYLFLYILIIGGVFSFLAQLLDIIVERRKITDFTLIHPSKKDRWLIWKNKFVTENNYKHYDYKDFR